MKNKHDNLDQLLREIQIIPSSEVKENRFNGSDAEAGCKGVCESGAGCKAFL